MKNLVLAAALAASFLASGCASSDALTSNEPVMDREYQTGSNIPRKTNSSSNSGVSTMDREAAERARDAQLPTYGTPFKP